MLDGIALIPLLAFVALASYFQTVTGFGLGMIVIGATSGFDLAPIPLVAAIVSLVSLVNGGIALPGRLHHIDWKAARMVLLAVPPAIILGVELLNYLSSQAAAVLRFMLGLAIVYSGGVFIVNPTQRSHRSSNLSFFASGFFSGIFGGLFGMAGPPVMYHFYRQPFDQAVIRNMLLLTFVATSLSRTLFVGTQGGLTPTAWALLSLMFPLVAGATLLGRKYPPPIDHQLMRRLAALVLIILGSSLIITSIYAIAVHA